MDEHIIVIETGYKRGSANYHIEHTDPLPQNEARSQYDALRAGTGDRLPAVDGAVVVDISDNQFLRLHSKLGATLMDRVSIGSSSVQRA